MISEVGYFHEEVFRLDAIFSQPRQEELVNRCHITGSTFVNVQ
jgi:hypothetical protein